MRRMAILAALAIGARAVLPAQAAENKGDPDDLRIRKILETKKVSFDFVETPLHDALPFMRALLDVNVVVAPEVRELPRVRLRVKDMKAQNALGWLLFLSNAKMAIKNRAIYVTPAAPAERQPPPLDKGPRALRVRQVFAKKVSFDFVETPFQDVLTFVSTLVDVNVIAAPELFKGKVPTVTLKVIDMKRGNAFYWCSELCGAKIELRGEAIFVGKADPKASPPRRKEPANDPATLKIKRILESKRVSFDFVGRPLPSAMYAMSHLGDVTFVAPGAPKDVTVTLRAENMKLDAALQWIVRLVGGRMEIRNEAVVITAVGAKPREIRTKRPAGGHL